MSFIQCLKQFGIGTALFTAILVSSGFARASTGYSYTGPGANLVNATMAAVEKEANLSCWAGSSSKVFRLIRLSCG